MSFIDIDEKRLDQEWLDHPSLVHEWADKEADADHAFKQAEDRLALVEAQLLLRVRKYPSKYGLDEKPTVDAIKAAVTAAPKYQQALAEVHAARGELLHCRAAMKALDHRRSALSNYVELISLGFNSGPRARSPEARERVNGTVRKGLKREGRP